ncbi:MAG: hypothetical protein ACJA1Z_003761 [Patiriisocius sp.]|jgi:hypothetical protein
MVGDWFYDKIIVAHQAKHTTSSSAMNKEGVLQKEALKRIIFPAACSSLTRP